MAFLYLKNILVAFMRKNLLNSAGLREYIVALGSGQAVKDKLQNL